MSEDLGRPRRQQQREKQAEEDRSSSARKVHRTQGVLAFGQLFPRTDRRTNGRLQRFCCDSHVVFLLTALLIGCIIYNYMHNMYDTYVCF